MSFILDALRRAESERERGHVPGLHAQPVPPGLGEAAQGRGTPPLPWLAALGLLAAVAGGLWWWSSKPAQPPAAPAAQVADSGPSAVTAAAPLPATREPAATTVPSQPPLLVAPPLPALPPVDALPSPRRESPPRPVVSAAAPAAAAVPATAPATPATPVRVGAPAAGTEPAAASATTRPLALAELSPAQRAELPAMTIGGAIHSEQAANRFLLVNGQVVREGEEAAMGVVLERINPKNAILRWRELRITLPL